MEDQGYRKLAMCVLARAVIDLQPADSHLPTTETHAMKTAAQFLADATNPVLVFWCSWLPVHPTRVSRAYQAGTLRSPCQTGHTAPYRRRRH
jgi:hypothetical protein